MVLEKTSLQEQKGNVLFFFNCDIWATQRAQMSGHVWDGYHALKCDSVM